MSSSNFPPPHRRTVFLPIRALTPLVAVLALAFAGTAPARGAVPASHDTTALGFIQHVVIGTPPCDTCPPQVCAGQPFRVTVSGVLPSPCYSFQGLQRLWVRQANKLFPTLQATFMVDTCGTACPAVEVPFSGSVEIEGNSTGAGFIGLIHTVRTCPDSVEAGVLSRTYALTPTDCGPPPEPPLDSLVRALTTLRVVPAPGCPGETLWLELAKNGCPPCVDLVSLTYDSLAGPQAVVHWTRGCMEFACFPETLRVALGQFAPGFHQIRVGVDVTVSNLPVPNTDTTISYTEHVAFEVARTCDSTSRDCVQPWLLARQNISGCAVETRPGQRAPLTLAVGTFVPLGGLQGALHCSEPFRIVGVRPPPGVPQLHVSWVADGRGARYVLFTSGGTVIPAGHPAVLQILVQADSSATIGQRGGLLAPIQVASGPRGENVPICDFSFIRPAPIPLCVTSPADSCDSNGDGRSDVRDLVLMTECLWPRTMRPEALPWCRDCSGDGTFGFEDLVCCARHILRGPFLPRDSVNANDALRVSFEPQRFGDGLLVRVRVSGAQGLAGAMLRLRYPAERWRAEVPLPVPFARTSSEGWLPIVDTEEPGLVQLGGLRIAEEASGDIDFEFAILPTAPPMAGDALVAEGADMVGGDGTLSTPSLPLPNLTLDAPGPPGDPPIGVELSAARPNPFARATSFTVSLPRESDVQLTVHDIAGRQVATLASGRLPAGRRDFTWAGAGARDGVYFVRLAVDGEVYSTRVALLRNGR